MTLIIAGQTSSADETQLPVTFFGGHETDRRDGGRPVVLVAGALGVTPDLFRQAFSGVTPARGGRPSPHDARRNKQALMKVLAPQGVSNDRLDEVSDYYRYRPEKGELWPITPARAHAIMEGGKVTRIVITDGGSGYSSPPTATLKGLKGVSLKVTLKYGRDFQRNGTVDAIEVIGAK